MLFSDRSRYAENPIEEEDRVAFGLQKKGEKIIKLSRGDPPSYFPTPKYILDAYIEALKEHRTTYSKSEGADILREAVAKRYRRLYKLDADPDSVLVTAGVSEALLFIDSAMMNEGDRAILFRPYYSLYLPILKTHGGRPIYEEYDGSKDWNINVERLSKSLKRLKADGKLNRVKYMMITNPNNPTGTVLDRNVLKEVVDLANEYRLLLISDEIYDEIVYNKAKFTSVCQLAKGMPYMVLNGASKVFDSTGFRIGFAITPENDKTSLAIREKLYDYALMRLSVNTPAQYAAAEAINNTVEHKRAINTMVSAIEKRANHATKLLNENPLFSTVRPNGAFYILPKIDLKETKFKDDREFVDSLLKEEDVQVTRGSGFGAPSHFRIVALAPQEILDLAINRINKFCRRHSR